MKQNHLVMLSPNMAPQFLWKVTPFTQSRIQPGRIKRAANKHSPMTMLMENENSMKRKGTQIPKKLD